MYRRSIVKRPWLYKLHNQIHSKTRFIASANQNIESASRSRETLLNHLINKSPHWLKIFTLGKYLHNQVIRINSMAITFLLITQHKELISQSCNTSLAILVLLSQFNSLNTAYKTSSLTKIHVGLIFNLSKANLKSKSNSSLRRTSRILSTLILTFCC
jgi:hypothetical protein